MSDGPRPAGAAGRGPLTDLPLERPEMLRKTALALALVCLFSTPALARDALVAKREFSVPAFAFESGKSLPVTVGYETYGKLNADGSNAILVCHYFSGNSHVAGRYAEADPQPGYWNDLVGSGKALDTDRYFIVSSDILANVNTRDPRVTATGPASRNPETGKPYGSAFPKVEIRDMVNVQRALMAHLGIPRWHAVMGASLGGLQTLQWAVSYPELVRRAVVVAATGRSNGFNQAMNQVMVDAIQADADWRKGDYHGHRPPQKGLKAAWELLFSLGHNREVLAERIPGAPNPRATPAYVAELDKLATGRLAKVDAGSWRTLAIAARDFDLARGHGSYQAALSRVQAKMLLLPLEGDMIFPPELVEEDVAQPLKGAGKRVALRVVPSKRGHYGALFDIAPMSPVIAEFLATP